MPHSKESMLNTKRTSKIYTNKLIKKTTDTKLQRILAVNKNIILADITMNDKRGQEQTERWRLKVYSVGEWTTMSGKLFQVGLLITRLEKKYLVATMVQ